MKVLMTGGTGFLGTALRRRLEMDGAEITVLSRSRTGSDGATTFLPSERLPDARSFDSAINLAGENVAGLWTPSKRRAIYDSRVSTTRRLAEWISKAPEKPRVFLSGSAVGIYGDRGSEELTEESDTSTAEGFMAKVCRDWEGAAAPVSDIGVRTVLLRTGQVLARGGGYFGTALPLMKRFPIVVLGPRESYFPWIALEDWVELAMFAIQNNAISGPLNLSSPNPVTQEAFTRAVAARLGKRVWGRVPKWALKLGAGEFGEAIAVSQRVLPAKALASGFRFRFSAVADCLGDVV